MKKQEVKEETSVKETSSESAEAKSNVKTTIVEEIKPEEVKDERAAIAYIYTSQNNTLVHITDLAGNTICRISGGMITKHSRLKADPTIAMFIAKRAAERAKDLGITSLDKEGFKIISVLDATRVPRGGPKKKGGKRGRRV